MHTYNIKREKLFPECYNKHKLTFVQKEDKDLLTKTQRLDNTNHKKDEQITRHKTSYSLLHIFIEYTCMFTTEIHQYKDLYNESYLSKIYLLFTFLCFSARLKLIKLICKV